MAAITPFASNLPSEVQMPHMAPNFSEVQSVAMRANSLFEQNLNQIHNDYSSVLSAPVTGEQMEQKKQQYINNFQTGVKKLATSDLSMPQNVLQAENLLSPFWSDGAMLKNIGLTKSGQGNIQTIQNGMLSKDEKERDMYNPIQVQDQQDMLSELADAGTDESKIDRIQKRTIAPFTNLTKLWSERAEKDHLAIKYTQGTNSPYLVSTLNGKQTIPEFKTWARGQLGPETEGMFQTIGRVAANHAKRDVLSRNPTLSGDQLNQAIASYTYDNLDRSYSNNIANYTTDISSIDRQLQDIENRSPMKNGQRQPTGNDLPIWIQLRKNKADYEDYLKDASDKYTTFRSSKVRTIASIAADPQDAFAQLHKDNQVESWATGEAANQQVDIKPNDAYYHLMQEARLSREETHKEQDDIAKNRIAAGNLATTWDENDVKGLKEGLIRNSNTGKWERDPNYVPDGKGSSAGNVNTATGDINTDTVDPLHVSNSYETYKATVVDAGAKKANDELFSIGGAAGNLIDSPVTINGKADKLSVTDIDLANQAIQKKWRDNNYSYTGAEKLALQKLGTVTGATDYLDPASMRVALEAKLGQVESNKDGTPNLNSLALASNISNAENSLQTSIAATKQLKDAVAKTITSNPAVYRKIISSNGNVITPEDIAKDISKSVSTITVKDENGKLRDLLPAEVANMRKNGKSITDMDIRAVNGKPVKHFADMNGHVHSLYYNGQGADGYGDDLQNMESYINSRYGNAETFGKLYKQAEDETMKIIKSLTATGEIGIQQGFRRNEPTQLPVLKATTAALSHASNTLPHYTTPDGKEVNESDIPMLRAMLAEGDKYVTDVQSIPYGGVASGPAVQIRFSPKDIPAGSDNPKYQEIMKAYPVVTMSMDPTTKNSVLQKLMVISGSGPYGDMLSGKSYGSNAVMKAHNFDCNIVPTGAPDENGHHSTFAISGTYGYVNPETGKVEKRSIQDKNGQVIQGTFSNTRPYQTIQMLNSEFLNTAKQNIANYEAYKKKDHNTPSYDVLEQQFQNQK